MLAELHTDMTLATPLSLNELHFYLTRAVVGICGSFSQATECARACGWLVCHGFALDELIQNILQKPCPAPPEFHWQEDGTLACSDTPIPALYAGSIIADYACAHPKTLKCDKVDHPLLLAGQIIPRLPKQTSWQLSLGQQGFQISGDEIHTYIPNSVEVSLSVWTEPLLGTKITSTKESVYHHGIPLTDATWTLLWQCFQNTLVPSNAESTLQGAGAGTNDND